LPMGGKFIDASLFCSSIEFGRIQHIDYLHSICGGIEAYFSP